MSAPLCLPVVLIALALGLGGCHRPAEASQSEPIVPHSSPVVVELFTSEGCSSCPPADRLLADLHATHGSDLIALAYHVDYWDRLGWTDPYGHPDFTARQRAYARRGDGRVYTPQMIVGGTERFVGSDRSRAEAAIGRAAELAVEISVTAHAEGDSVQVDVTVPETPSGAVLHLALVQKQTHTDVPRGENRGRRLAHVRVVRQLVSGPATSGVHRLAVPDGLRAGDVRVVALVQDGPVGQLLAAAETAVTR